MLRRSCHSKTLLVVAAQITFLASGAIANVVIDRVPVGNVGNPGDTRYPSGGVSSFGGVGYMYSIGKFEVTVGQYTEFLNKVAATDTYGLYNALMADPSSQYVWGCNIQRSGSPGSYTYTVGNGSPTDVTNWASRPVNYVSYWDSCRFANWMHNGQPTGAQGVGTTETGAYTLSGYTGSDGHTIQRNTGWTWAVASEDEWYKAAYHKNNGVTANYWNCPTRTNDVPSNVVSDPDPGNSANYFDYNHATGNGTWSIGSPYYRTEVGEFENSYSPYGTFDQGGNVWEWNEALITGGPVRGLRGGSFYQGIELLASDRTFSDPSIEYSDVGFRLSAVPEPATVAMLVLAGAELLRRRRAVNGG